MSLATLLRRGVGLQLAVLPEPSADELAETLVVFANTDGGTVLLGVDASGQITGTCCAMMPRASCARPCLSAGP